MHIISIYKYYNTVYLLKISRVYAMYILSIYKYYSAVYLYRIVSVYIIYNTAYLLKN
jgi:hypothetical protein